MILSSIKSGENQIIKQNNQYLINAIEIIKNTDFSRINDGKHIVRDDSFYFILTSYRLKILQARYLPNLIKDLLIFIL